MLKEFPPQDRSHVSSTQFSQFQPQADDTDAVTPVSPLIGLDAPLDTETMGIQDVIQAVPEDSAYTDAVLPSLNKTRQEVLSNILGRIPQAFITGEEIDFRQTMGLTIVDEFTPATMMATSRQEEVAAHTGSGTILQKRGQDTTLSRGKRLKAKYSFTGRMLEKHPVLKFSATGPMDKDKSPLKWWSRVCRVELSLMNRGSLELISHYSYDVQSAPYSYGDARDVTF